MSSFGWALAYIGGGLLLAARLRAQPVPGRQGAAGPHLAVLGGAVVGAVQPPVLAAAAPACPGPAAAAAAGRPNRCCWPASGSCAGRWPSCAATRLTVAFLIAFLVYNDGIQTVTTVAAQYGDKELHLDDTVLLSAILLVQFVAFGGALWLGRLAERFGAKRVVLGSLVAWLLLVLAAYLVRSGTAWQFYLLAVGIAVVLGGSQALSRSMFSRLIPRRLRGGVLRLLRDQRLRDVLARPADLRPGLPAQRLLPQRAGVAGGLLRRSASCCWLGCRCGRRSPRPATPRRSGSEQCPDRPVGGEYPRQPCLLTRADRPAGPRQRPGLGARRRQPPRDPDARPPEVLLRADGLRQVHAGAADGPQPCPAGPVRADPDPLRPLRRGPGHHPGRAQPRRHRGHRLPRHAPAGPRALGAWAGGWTT